MHRRGTMKIVDIRINGELNPSLMTQHRNHPKPCKQLDLDHGLSSHISWVGRYAGAQLLVWGLNVFIFT